MENTIHTLKDIFSLAVFSIPQYQRAYSWVEEPHLSAFLNDIRQQAKAFKDNPGKTYFLGTLLLHQVDPTNRPKDIDIVDGQQRLTTSVIFIAAALEKLNKNVNLNPENLGLNVKQLRRAFIYDDDDECQKFNTIQEDNPYFRSSILKLVDSTTTEQSPSSKRLIAAYNYFLNNVDDSEWASLLYTLQSAKVMIYSVSSAEDATLIFELQNDRGKKLTDLEALKSYLMHLIYLNAKNSKDGLAEIQTHFSNIYRDVERQMSNNKVPDEDSILAYHTVGAISWANDEWRQPKNLIKQTIKNIPGSEIQKWILIFVAELRETYKVFTELFNSFDEYPELVELVILDRMASFWPLIIKSWKLDKSKGKENFRLVIRLLEVYTVRGYGLSNLRSDAGFTSLYLKARDFSGDFSKLHAHLYSMSYWYDIENRSRDGVDRAGLYRSNKKDALYILWRYENALRSQPGKKQEHLSWKHYLQPTNNASKLSLEHIAAQNNPISKTMVKWDNDDVVPFKDVATDRLGNLVVDSVSANSSKGKYDFSDKLESLSTNSTFLSQGELVKWAEDCNDKKCWTIQSIKNRHEHLKTFVFDTWNPDKYFTPDTELISEEPIENEVEVGEN